RQIAENVYSKPKQLIKDIYTVFENSKKYNEAPTTWYVEAARLLNNFEDLINSRTVRGHWFPAKEFRNELTECPQCFNLCREVRMAQPNVNCGICNKAMNQVGFQCFNHTDANVHYFCKNCAHPLCPTCFENLTIPVSEFVE
ncbi:hypothetical protein RFI_06105, partial [Reticulomyxa filosa]